MADGIHGDNCSHYWIEEDMATRVIHDTKGRFGGGAKNVIDTPCSTITIGGIGSANSSHYQVVVDDQPERSKKQTLDKPLYRVPSMAEIAAIPWNGFKVASTFSGCGGSCLGYRMAGFRVVWANEFVPIAQASYKANAAADSILDGRDIRNIKPEEILTVTGLRKGELDLFDGSPPCQAFSTAGKREKGWGKAKVYEHGAKQCNETLFDEYICLLRGLMPKTFVAENVSGLVKGTAKGWFLDVLKALKESGYRVKAKLLDAQWLGVPQMRQRIIFIGVREDLGLEPVHPQPLPYRYSVREALPWISRLVQTDCYDEGNRMTTNLPSPAVTVVGIGAKRRAKTHIEISGRLGTHLDEITIGCDRPMSCITTEDQNIRIGVRQNSLLPPSRQKSDAFNLASVSERKPCPTVTVASPGNDLAVPLAGSTQKRKFTIAELKRICAFPDDFQLAGTYGQQWERLGNAVPPLMMRAVAESVRDEVLRKVQSAR